MSEVLRLRITLAEIEPPIWRTVLVPASMTLHELHRTIQVIFDWYDYHLYEFEVAGERYEAPDEEATGADSTKARLSRFRLGPGETLLYRYDFGDDWEHVIEVEARESLASLDWVPWVVDGERRGPQEDSGGPRGYMELLQLLKRPADDLDEEERGYVRWLGPDFDPDAFNLEQARHALLLASAWGALRRRR
jgi:hypothetical protein